MCSVIYWSLRADMLCHHVFNVKYFRFILCSADRTHIQCTTYVCYKMRLKQIFYTSNIGLEYNWVHCAIQQCYSVRCRTKFIHRDSPVIHRGRSRSCSFVQTSLLQIGKYKKLSVKPLLVSFVSCDVCRFDMLGHRIYHGWQTEGRKNSQTDMQRCCVPHYPFFYTKTIPVCNNW